MGAERRPRPVPARQRRAPAGVAWRMPASESIGISERRVGQADGQRQVSATIFPMKTVPDTCSHAADRVRQGGSAMSRRKRVLLWAGLLGVLVGVGVVAIRW